MNKILFTPLLLLSSLFSNAQKIVLETWEDKPKLHTLDKQFQNESAVVLYDLRRMEYYDEKDGLVGFKTLHRIVKVLDDKGIESYNKIYLGVANSNDILDIKARSIQPDGKIVNLDRNDIKDYKDDEGNMYKIFAIEGLVKGSEVEYYYTYKRSASFFMKEIIQESIPVVESNVEIIGPKRLIFEPKVFNISTITQSLDTSDAERRIVRFKQQNIVGAENEKYSNYRSNLQRIEYKLSYNASRSTSERLFTWNELAKRVFDIYNQISDKDFKRIGDFIDKNKFDAYNSERDKIVAVEQYIKKNIRTGEDIDGQDFENIEKILKNKIASHGGIIRLYAGIFSRLGISYNFVLTGDRSTFTLDKSFENWSNAENTLFYFPNLKKFMAPTALEYRFPWIRPDWGGTNGLFCKSTTIGSFNTAVGEVKPIPLEDYTSTLNNIEASVTIDPVKDSLLIDIKQIYTGYTSAIYRATFTFTSAEEQRNILKEMVKFGTKSENIVSSKLENADFESYPDNKPFVLSASVRANELMERAGDKILVKIGEIIGPQVEMYQEKPRQFPMELDYGHILDRTIEFKVPEGYKLKNPEDLKINHVYLDNGKQTMGFVSDYKLEGNKLKIRITEDYRLLYYPVSIYEDYKRIINAAADFNKIVLVLEKL
ncbi:MULTISPECIES: DUF3857 domain-containing protein [unclassified Paraflavitalea]|uniref:DUF3857 domain-containing protein n=1 Tax=unclassified Paraflavitalea TaxID=2798305 RepID=UPI003D32A402